MQEPQHPDRIAWPQSRFVYRPNGSNKPPVLECNLCTATFSGWPGTYRHNILRCLVHLIDPRR